MPDQTSQPNPSVSTAQQVPTQNVSKKNRSPHLWLGIILLFIIAIVSYYLLSVNHIIAQNTSKITLITKQQAQMMLNESCAYNASFQNVTNVLFKKTDGQTTASDIVSMWAMSCSNVNQSAEGYITITMLNSENSSSLYNYMLKFYTSNQSSSGPAFGPPVSLNATGYGATYSILFDNQHEMIALMLKGSEITLISVTTTPRELNQTLILSTLAGSMH